MSVLFDEEQAHARPGDRAQFPFQLSNDTGRRERYHFALDTGALPRPVDWRIEASSLLEKDEVTHGFLDVFVPLGTHPGSYPLRLEAIPERATPCSEACTLVIEPRIFFPSIPDLHLNRDGSISVTLPIFKHGQTELSISIEVKHEKGWRFRCSPPEIHLGSEVGRLHVELTLVPEPGHTAKAGDELTFELSYEGHPLPPESRRLPADDPLGVPRGWLLAGLALAIIGSLVGGAVASGRVGRDPTPTPSATTTAPSLVPLVAPQGLEAQAMSPNDVYLSWAPPPDPDGYRVIRNGAAINAVLITSLNYDDKSVSSGQTYRYAVEAVSGGRYSPPSNVVEVTTPKGPPPATYSLVVVELGTGTGILSSNLSGIACPPTCSTSLAKGAVITLTAVPSKGSVFTGWGGGGCSGSGPCALRVVANQQVTGRFEAQAPTLTFVVAVVGMGSVTSDSPGVACPPSCSTSLVSGAAVTLTAAPAKGSVFAGWGGGGCSGTDACVLTIFTDEKITASFEPVPAIVIDDAPAVSVTASVTATAGTATFHVSLSKPIAQSVSVDYQTADGTGTAANHQYMPTTGTLIFAPYQTRQAIKITVPPQCVSQPFTFVVQLTNSTNSTVSRSQGTATVNTNCWLSYSVLVPRH